ncbi:MAG TPA: peptidoglycan-binding domain-containing protein [Enteractinococcus sp.]
MSYFLAASLVKLRNEVNALWPNRSKVSDGWIGDAAHSARKSDHNPDWSAPGRRRGVVRALDITTRGIDVDRLLRHTTNDSRVAYVIYNRRIYTHARGWYAYTGSNPHTNHVHVSIAHTNTAENDTKTWISSISGGTSTASTTKPAAKPKPVSKPATVKTGEWPTYALLVDGKYQSLTKRGYQRLLAPKNVGNYQGRIDAVMGALTTKAEQTWLKRLGFYRGLIDGQRGPVTIKALQRFLRSKRFYSGLIDGKFQTLSIKGLQQYLNSQRKFYK